MRKKKKRELGAHFGQYCHYYEDSFEPCQRWIETQCSEKFIPITVLASWKETFFSIMTATRKLVITALRRWKSGRWRLRRLGCKCSSQNYTGITRTVDAAKESSWYLALNYRVCQDAAPLFCYQQLLDTNIYCQSNVNPVIIKAA